MTETTSQPTSQHSLIRRLFSALGWTRSSYALLGGFMLIVFLIIYIWWPLAEEILAYIDWGGKWWLYFDWLLVGIFLIMTLLIMSGADLRRDALIVFVGFVGGLVIEGWGTQTNLWFYFTAQRPPLWIIPAWPIASLSIDRLVRFLRNRLGGVDWARYDGSSEIGEVAENLTAEHAENVENLSGFPQRTSRSPWLYRLLTRLKPKEHFYKFLYWPVFIGFGIYMLVFVWPTIDKPLTLMALALVAFLTLTPTDSKEALFNFVAGSGLGYFLELWGTTRECWTYYTFQTPPFFAVLAHGMAAVAFWRAGLVVKMVWDRLTPTVIRIIRLTSEG